MKRKTPKSGNRIKDEFLTILLLLLAVSGQLFLNNCINTFGFLSVFPFFLLLYIFIIFLTEILKLMQDVPLVLMLLQIKTINDQPSTVNCDSRLEILPFITYITLCAIITKFSNEIAIYMGIKKAQPEDGDTYTEENEESEQSEQSETNEDKYFIAYRNVLVLLTTTKKLLEGEKISRNIITERLFHLERAMSAKGLIDGSNKTESIIDFLSNFCKVYPKENFEKEIEFLTRFIKDQEKKEEPVSSD